MSENISYKCSCCGELHEEWPALTYLSPDNYNYLSEGDKKIIGYLDNDFCIINYSDQVDRFIRCTLTQRVNEYCEDLDYGLWVSLSEKSYLDYEKNFKTESKQRIYFGWLCNEINDYKFSESIPMDVVTRNNGERPELIPHKDFDHPFVKDYYNGISKKEAERRISIMLDVVSKNEFENEVDDKKKWWEIWK